MCFRGRRSLKPDFSITTKCENWVIFIPSNLGLQFIAESHMGIVISQMTGWKKIFVTSKIERLL